MHLVLSYRRAAAFAVLSLLPVSTILSGCSGAASFVAPIAAPPVIPVPTVLLSGTVRSGPQPIAGAVVQVYAAGSRSDGSAATPLLTTPILTDAAGAFSVSVACSGYSDLYAAATGGSAGTLAANSSRALIAAIGACPTSGQTIQMDEVTTAAAAAALIPYLQSVPLLGAAPAEANQLGAGFTLAAEFASASTGLAPGALPLNTTAPTAQLNALANAIVPCSQSTGGRAGDGSPCGILFTLATPPNAAAPTDTLAALINIASNPTLNAEAIYALAPSSAPFQPTLTSVPWNFALNLTNSTATVPYTSYTAFGDSITAGCCAMSARLTGAILTSTQQSLTNFTGIANGGFDLPLDGKVVHSTGLNLSSAQSLYDVATLIQASLGTNAYLQWNQATGSFVVGSVAAPTQSSVGYLQPPATGTDLSALLRLDAASNGVFQAGDTNFAPYVSLVGQGLGLVPVNNGASGETSYIQASPIYAQPVAATGYPLFSYAIGTNDDYVAGGPNTLPGGNTASVTPQFYAGILAEDAWLTIPDGPSKQRANTFCTGSGWSASTLQTWPFSQITTTAGSTCSTQIAGSTIYVGYTISYGSNSAFTVTVDGVPTGAAVSTTPALCTYGCTGPVSLSIGGFRNYGQQAVRLAGLTPGQHTVTITATGGSGPGSEFYLDWIGSNAIGSPIGGPRLLMGGTLRQGIGDPYTDDGTGNFDNQIRNAVAALRSDGLNVTFVDIRATQEGSNINFYLNTDLTHPNEAGHANLALAYLKAAQ